jgi:hypothetical protein
MAVTDQTTVRELVRAVTETLRDEPVVRRFWYRIRNSPIFPHELSATFHIVLDTDDETARRRIEDAVDRAQAPYQEEIGSVIRTLTGVPQDVHDLSDWIPDEAVEVPLHNR